MLLYLFRWGHRRGAGRFADTYGDDKEAPTIRSTVDKLVNDPTIIGFENGLGKAILGDFLLTSILENKRHAESHDEQVQRCFANHYFASWIDLPATAANLRGVPEMLTALLSNQPDGDIVKPFGESGRYRVGARIQDNALLAVLATGTRTDDESKSSNRTTSDKFDERVALPIDQLLTVRLAQGCGEAPSKARGRNNPDSIPNQRPIAINASRSFREDLIVFLEHYARANTTPRAVLLPMLESAMAVGLTTILTATIEIVNQWGASGRLPSSDVATVFSLLIDCSSGSDPALREASERSGFLLRQALNDR
jgi:hypothetical protein